MKNIVITRPQEQSKALANYIERQNHKAICEPIFVVENLHFLLEKNDFSALIITSINARDALEKIAPAKEIKIFTIGKKLAQSLQEKGFYNLEIAENAKNLAQKIANFEGKILYLRGEKITFDFAEKFNFVSEKIVYKIIANPSFSAGFLDFCSQNSIHEVLIFSKNSADIFINLAKKHDLLEFFFQSKIVCLSEKIRQYVENQGFTQNEIFAENLIVKSFYE